VQLQIASHSHYPRIGETDQQLKLRRAYHAIDRKKISSEDLKATQQETIRTVLAEQHAAALDVVTDGLILWNDPVSHLMKNLEGVKVGGLLRFFDTNSYFRQPIVEGKVKRTQPLLVEEVSFLVKEAISKTKAVLTGPWTLALLSKIQTDAYKSVEALASDLTTVIAEEVAALSKTGVDHIQIEEPGYLLSQPSNDWAKSSIAAIAKEKGKTQLGLVTFFGDAASLYDTLQAFPVDYLGFDLTYSPTLLKTIKEKGSQKDLMLGVLDGRNTKLEVPSEVLKEINQLASSLEEGRTVTVSTSSGLEYLPRNRAQDKLQLLKAIKDENQKGA
jgi:5-methyltetrahydropteroyltriglutamate--homocysteine methyltransferase